MNNKLDNYKQELTYYYDKYEFTPSENGYFYITPFSLKNGTLI